MLVGLKTAWKTMILYGEAGPVARIKCITHKHFFDRCMGYDLSVLGRKVEESLHCKCTFLWESKWHWCPYKTRTLSLKIYIKTTAFALITHRGNRAETNGLWGILTIIKELYCYRSQKTNLPTPVTNPPSSRICKSTTARSGVWKLWWPQESLLSSVCFRSGHGR